jgi:hypothetical protein
MFRGEPGMGQFELAVHPDKARLIRIGSHAAEQREKLGEGKPETFTHFCTQSRVRHRRQDDQEGVREPSCWP